MKHGSSSWSGDQTRVHAMETQGVLYSQKISCATMSRKNHGKSFLTLRRYSFFGIYTTHEIHATQDNHYWRRLCFNNGGITREYHTATPWKVSAGVLLLHDNAPAHKSCISRAAIRKCGFVELNHPPYSPDLSPSDYFLFRNLKNFCVGDDFLMTMQSRKL